MRDRGKLTGAARYGSVHDGRAGRFLSQIGDLVQIGAITAPENVDGEEFGSRARQIPGNVRGIVRARFGSLPAPGSPLIARPFAAFVLKTQTCIVSSSRVSHCSRRFPDWLATARLL